jgi:hypothetical protein
VLRGHRVACMAGECLLERLDIRDRAIHDIVAVKASRGREDVQDLLAEARARARQAVNVIRPS